MAVCMLECQLFTNIWKVVSNNLHVSALDCLLAFSISENELRLRSNTFDQLSYSNDIIYLNRGMHFMS